MTDCILKDGACINCGWKWAGDPAVHRMCPATILPRTEAEQAACEAICRTNRCGCYDPVADACRRCGCASQRREAWQGKLRVGDCPKNLWPALKEKPDGR